jgi:hypothetical protein
MIVIPKLSFSLFFNFIISTQLFTIYSLVRIMNHFRQETEGQVFPDSHNLYNPIKDKQQHNSIKIVLHKQ